jgi:hypothetical protein
VFGTQWAKYMITAAVEMQSCSKVTDLLSLCPPHTECPHIQYDYADEFQKTIHNTEMATDPPHLDSMYMSLPDQNKRTLKQWIVKNT